MSAVEPASNTTAPAEGERRRNSRGRGGRGRDRRRRGPRGPKKEGEEAEGAERRVRKIPDYVAVPDSMVGTKQVGIVNTVIKKGGMRFGFILIGESAGVDDITTAPRVYFNFSNIKDSDLILRRTYKVSFICKKDDKDRTFADEVELTEEGKTIQTEREAVIAQRKIDFPDGPPGREGGKRRERKAPEPRMVTLKVSCEGLPEEKSMEVNLSSSVGRIKGLICEAFGAPAELSIYLVTDGGEKVFLDRDMKAAMKDGDKIHLEAKKD